MHTTEAELRSFKAAGLVVEGTQLNVLKIIMREALNVRHAKGDEIKRLPSWREIGKELGITQNAVNCHLLSLKAKGLITWEPGGVARTLRPTCRFIPASQL